MLSLKLWLNKTFRNSEIIKSMIQKSSTEKDCIKTLLKSLEDNIIKKIDSNVSKNVDSRISGRIKWQDLTREERRDLIPLPKCVACRNRMGPGKCFYIVFW